MWNFDRVLDDRTPLQRPTAGRGAGDVLPSWGSVASPSPAPSGFTRSSPVGCTPQTPGSLFGPDWFRIKSPRPRVDERGGCCGNFIVETSSSTGGTVFPLRRAGTSGVFGEGSWAGQRALRLPKTQHWSLGFPTRFPNLWSSEGCLPLRCERRGSPCPIPYPFLAVWWSLFLGEKILGVSTVAAVIHWPKN